MDVSTIPRVDTENTALSELTRRKKRLLEIVDNGLPPFPHTVLELTATLSSPTADVKQAAKLIRTDPSLSAQVLRMCNSPMFGLRSRVLGIEQAATLLGTDRLRTLALTTSMIDFAGHGLPQEQVNTFWEHSFLAAMLSEHLAKSIHYPEKEQAYIAGLLHDIGRVPHWMLASEEKAKKHTPPPEGWFDNTRIERDYFGMDHCEAGSRMATSWNFMPSFIDVLVNHHQSDQAQHDPYLVQIVGTVEYYLLAKDQLLVKAKAESDTRAPGDDAPQAPIDVQVSEIAPPPFMAKTSKLLGDTDWKTLVENLDTEYDRLLPIVQRGLQSVIAGTA